MAEVIQFHCPACGTTLRVPAAAAGFLGPCPRCRQEIIGPDPDLGQPARRAGAAAVPPPGEDFSPVPAAPPAEDPFPFSSSSAPAPEPEKPEKPKELEVPLREQPELAPPVATTPPSTPDSARLVRLVFILSCAVAALIGLMAGFLIGSRQPPPPPVERGLPAKAVAPPAPDPVIVDEDPPEPPAEAPKPEPEPEKPAEPESQAAPRPEPAPPEPPAAEPSVPAPETAAEAALKAFLAAPDRQSRAAFVLHPDRIREKMERYHDDSPDGPTPFLSLRPNAANQDPESGILVYHVTTEAMPSGFPVSLVTTPDGWKVDWETFVEFRDDHFEQFASGAGTDTGSFHLIVRNSHYFGDPFPGSDKLSAFRLDPPMPERNHYGFVPTGSDLHKRLAGATEWGVPCTPVLQLVRKQHEDGSFHLEITGFAALDWRPSTE